MNHTILSIYFSPDFNKDEKLSIILSNIDIFMKDKHGVVRDMACIILTSYIIDTMRHLK